MLRVPKHESIETWYSAVVCFIISYNNAILTGWLAANAVLVSELETVYKNTHFVEALASTIPSLSGTIGCFSNFLWVIVLRKLSIKYMAIGASLLFGASVAISTLNSDLSLWIVTYSVPVGLNVAILSASSAILQPLYFDRHVGLVNGILSCAGGLMVFVFPILWSIFIPQYGFQVALYIFAGMIATNAIPFIFLRRKPIVKTKTIPPPAEVNSDGRRRTSTDADSDIAEPASSINETTEDYSSVDSSDDQAELIPQPIAATSVLQRLKGDFHFELFRDRNFMVFSISIGTIGLGLMSVSVHLVAFAKLYFPNENTDLLVSAIGLASTFSKLASGALVDFLPIKLSYYFIQLCIVLCSLTIVAISFLMTTTPHFYVILILVTFYGILESPLLAMPIPILFRLLKKESIPIAAAYQSAMLGIAIAIGPPCSGMLYDLTYSYALCYQVGPIIMLCGAILMFFAKLDVKQ